MASEIRQNYDEECEAAINRHVNGELHSSYHYQAMVSCKEEDAYTLDLYFCIELGAVPLVLCCLLPFLSMVGVNIKLKELPQSIMYLY